MTSLWKFLRSADRWLRRKAESRFGPMEDWSWVRRWVRRV